MQCPECKRKLRRIRTHDFGLVSKFRVYRCECGGRYETVEVLLGDATREGFREGLTRALDEFREVRRKEATKWQTIAALKKGVEVRKALSQPKLQQGQGNAGEVRSN